VDVVAVMERMVNRHKLDYSQRHSQNACQKASKQLLEKSENMIYKIRYFIFIRLKN
jgi:hypothetical protein